MHDGLTSMGFRGFFDVDNLKMISQEALELAVKESVSMIVFVHDETCESEWCRFEWEVAKSIGLPVICVIDMVNCVKATVISRVQEVDQYLLSNQCLEYTHKHRRETMKELAQWLHSL